MTGCHSVSPHRDALKGSGEENFPKDRASDRGPDHPLLHGKRRSLKEDYIWQTEQIIRLKTKRSEKGYMDGPMGVEKSTAYYPSKSTYPGEDNKQRCSQDDCQWTSAAIVPDHRSHGTMSTQTGKPKE